MLLPVEKWDFFELELTAQLTGNPFLDVNFSADFTHNHRSINVTGFYDGNGVYKVRFMPDMEGAWHFVTHSNLAALNDQRGEFSCTPPTGKNHGPVRVIDPYHENSRWMPRSLLRGGKRAARKGCKMEA